MDSKNRCEICSRHFDSIYDYSETDVGNLCSDNCYPIFSKNQREKELENAEIKRAKATEDMKNLTKVLQKNYLNFFKIFNNLKK